MCKKAEENGHEVIDEIYGLFTKLVSSCGGDACSNCYKSYCVVSYIRYLCKSDYCNIACHFNVKLNFNCAEIKWAWLETKVGVAWWKVVVACSWHEKKRLKDIK